MITSRTSANAELPRLIDNLERVADDLVAYLNNLERPSDLVDQMETARKEYKKPLNSWVWYWIYVFTRTRNKAIDNLILTIKQRSESRTVLDAIDQWFSFGGWESTSYNSYLTEELTLALPGYSDTRENFSLADPKENLPIKRLKDLLLERTGKILRPSPDSAAEKELKLQRKQKLEAELIALTKELSNAAEVVSIDADTQKKIDDQLVQERAKELEAMRNKRDVRKDGKAMQLNSVFKSNDTASVGKLNKKRIAHLNQALGAIFGAQLVERGFLKPEDVVNQPKQGDANMKFEVKKLNPVRIKELEDGLFGMLSSQASRIEAEAQKAEAAQSAVTASNGTLSREEMRDLTYSPPPTPTLSRAAFEAPADNAKFVAPARRPLALTQEQRASMNRLFSANLPAKDAEEKSAPSSPVLK